MKGLAQAKVGKKLQNITPNTLNKETTKIVRLFCLPSWFFGGGIGVAKQNNFYTIFARPKQLTMNLHLPKKI